MADYVSFLAELKARRDAIEAEQAALTTEAEELDSLIVGIQRLAARQAERSPVALVRPGNSKQSKPKTMPEAVAAYLGSVAISTYSTRDVKEGVIAMGWKRGGNIRGHVYNTLDRLSQANGPIRRHMSGRWSLKAWGLPEGETNTNRDDLLEAAR